MSPLIQKIVHFPQNTTTLTSSYKLPKRLLHLIKIPVEKGLDAQNFRCKTCCRNIGVGFGQFKNCALNGNYYCEDCFSSGGDSLIPSYAILNTDFKPKYISNSSRVLLQSIMDQPLFKVDFLNPYIYEHSKNMRKIRDIRRKLGYSVMYLLSCKNSVANDIRRRLWPHNHLHSDIHAYSLMDLECVANGTLERRLSTLLASTLSHIWDCPLCLQKGFFCELCSSDRPIYPFQTETVCQCPNCSACFHRTCSTKFGLKEVKDENLNEKDFQKNSNEDTQECQQNNCPKCLRRAKLASSAGGLFSSSPSSLLNLSPGSSHHLLSTKICDFYILLQVANKENALLTSEMVYLHYVTFGTINQFHTFWNLNGRFWTDLGRNLELFNNILCPVYYYAYVNLDDIDI
ncbi:RUN domain-containing protein [Meloidogyne graminicola]|uniref:RUN domain-containing protein n=1 Tax=Meloidogyne graminicola TaxID=189291 RepID=A0A8S9ZY19_9BILA|nr:RUN domain-containing protein [Meloidogyne graminicola]